MDGSERIESEGKVIAIVVRKNSDVEGVKFYTPDTYPFQLGVHTRDKGDEIKPHLHKPIARTITDTHEMVRVDYGRVDVDLYNENGMKAKIVTLEKGDTILFVSGGHGFRFLEKTGLMEVKQGPYKGKEDDKKMIDNR